MLYRQRGHQCLCGLTPLLRASFYIARLFLSGKVFFLKKTLPLSKIFVISERVCFFFPIRTAPVKAEKLSLHTWGKMNFYELMNFPQQVRVTSIAHSPSLIEPYRPSPSEMLFGVFRVLFLFFSVFLLAVFTEEGNPINTGTEIKLFYFISTGRITFKTADSLLSTQRGKSNSVDTEKKSFGWIQSCTYG